MTVESKSYNTDGVVNVYRCNTMIRATGKGKPEALI